MYNIDGMTINETWTKKNVDQRARGLIWSTIQAFTYTNWRKPRKISFRIVSVSQRLESVIRRVQIRDIVTWAKFLVHEPCKISDFRCEEGSYCGLLDYNTV
jgi:hypothetical protein